jgi:uncharacterized integral membrane protein
MVMRKFLSAVVVIPLALVLVIFAVANRHLVTVSFDPFNPDNPAVSIRLPLFVIIVAVAILGVAAGGSASWFRHRRWRRAARRHEADARRAQRELTDLRTSAARLQRLPSLPQPSGHGAAGRDKQGATL